MTHEAETQRLRYDNQTEKTPRCPLSGVHTHLRSVLSKDADKSVRVRLQTFVEETRPQVLRSVRHLHTQEVE